jgi:hypothetical protein
MEKRLLLSIVVSVLSAMPLSAAWIPGDPALFQQLPDVSASGIDVCNTTPVILADDFTLENGGLIRDIHFWGSWLSDNAGSPSFLVAILPNVAATEGTTFDQPGGTPLWYQTFGPSDFSSGVVGVANEIFYDPQTNQVLGTDTQIWQYDFMIDAASAFSASPDIKYWLAIQKTNAEDGPVFGWKTSFDQTNQTPAVWQAIGDGNGNQELRYQTGQPVNLSFAVTPEPVTIAFFGLGSLLVPKRRKRVPRV